MRKRSSISAVLVCLAAVLVVAGAALILTAGVVLAATYDSPSKVTSIGANTLNWTGQGGGSDFQQQCSGDTAAPGSMLWILTTDGGSVNGSPSLTVNGTTYTGVNHGGSWHFLTAWSPPNTTDTHASASFNTAATGNGSWVLTISHGCPAAAPAASPLPSGSPSSPPSPSSSPSLSPSPSASTSPGASPAPSPGASPAPSPTPGGGVGGAGTTGGSGGSGASAGTSGQIVSAANQAAAGAAPALAATGMPVLLSLAGCVMLALGALLLARRRRAVRP
jgi:hypothetical protein